MQRNRSNKTALRMTKKFVVKLFNTTEEITSICGAIGQDIHSMKLEDGKLKRTKNSKMKFKIDPNLITACLDDLRTLFTIANDNLFFLGEGVNTLFGNKKIKRTR